VDQIGNQSWQPIELALCPAIFDRHVLALDEARFRQASLKCGNLVTPEIAGRPDMKIADHGHRRLLRACPERPHGG
jgi:hypothetical protein